MGQSTPGKLNVGIQASIDRILEQDSLSRQEYIQLTSAMLSGQQMSEADYQKANVLFDRLQMGRVTLENE